MRKIISLMLVCAAVVLAACSKDSGIGAPGKTYAVGDLYPDEAAPAGVVFWVNRADASHGLVVSFDQATNVNWETALGWHSAHALPFGKTWRIPSKDELQYLYCAWQGAAPTTWSGHPEFSENPDAAARFRTALTTSGIGFSAEYYWTSEEGSDGDAWVVGFASGLTGLQMKLYAEGFARSVASF